MANISDAHGSMELRSKSKKAIVHLVFLIQQRLARLEYSTQINSYGFQHGQTMEERFKLIETELESKILHIEEEYILCEEFFGVGRWNYESNIKSFKRDIAYKQKNEPDWIEECFQSIKNEDITITFQYVDYESGMDFLEKVSVQLNFKTEEITTVDYDNYDINMTNLRSVMNYNACDTSLQGILILLEYMCEQSKYKDIVNIIIKHKSKIVETIQKKWEYCLFDDVDTAIEVLGLVDIIKNLT